MDSARRNRLLALLIFAVALVVAIIVIVAGGEDEGSDSPEVAADGSCPEVEAPEPKDTSFKRPERVLDRGEEATAVVETSCGSFTIELDTQGSPRTANSFAFLAEEGFYDDTIFHRIAPGFVLQGGDPEGTGNGGHGY